MLSLIEVTCPHCAARGQIMMPALGAIVIGPCPECNGMVAVFCGQVLPLDHEIMTSGDNEARKNHVGAVLSDFVRERVERLFTKSSGDDSATPSESAPHHQSTTPRTNLPAETPRDASDRPISHEEFKSFVNVDLRLLDNSQYFKAIFDGS